MVHLKRLPFRTWLPSIFVMFLIGCSGNSTGSIALDRLIKADYRSWNRLIVPRLDFIENEIMRLNPHYELARRESITRPVQKVILSLLALQKKDGVVVELGSWTGGGVLLMAPYLTHDRSYHAVDTFNADTMPDEYVQRSLKGRKHLDVFKDNIAPVKAKVVVHQGFTNDIAASWPRDLKIDLLFIDADHSYKGVSDDWKNWSPFVKKGGVIVFHDYYINPEGGYQDLLRFIDETIVPLAGKDFYSVKGIAWYVVR